MSTEKIKSPLQVGNLVFIRCVTHYFTGKVEEVTEHEIVLSSAAWVADTGRFSEALRKGTLSEIEPFPDPVSVGRGSVVDVTLWNHKLPTEVA